MDKNWTECLQVIPGICLESNDVREALLCALLLFKGFDQDSKTTNNIPWDKIILNSPMVDVNIWWLHTFQTPKQRLLRRNRRLNITPLMIKNYKMAANFTISKKTLTENNEAMDVVMEIDVTTVSTRPKRLDEPKMFWLCFCSRKIKFFQFSFYPRARLN